MIAFYQKHRRQSCGLRRVLLFGAGLIGNSLARRIRTHDDFLIEYCSSNWNKEDNLEIHSRAISDALTRGPRDQPLEVIWSAGSAGFGIDSAGAERELCNFEAHVVELEALAYRASTKIYFTLISSAGGLFEGQRLVGPESVPFPRRPYGELKMAMEKAVELASFPVKRILRPTTVFGYIRPRQRRGLITALIENGVRRTQSEIFGTISTLRDYIFVEDIAGFVCRRIFSDEADRNWENALLASGKPSSVGEVIHLIETELRSRLQFRCSLDPWNTAQMTYQLTTFIDGHHPTPLSTAVRIVLRDFRTRF